MLRHFAEIADALRRLRKDRDGVISFEYVIVAIVVISTAGLVFNANTGGLIQGALATALNSIATAVTAAVGG
jgi:pilus assembly protein Flp/PilA